MKNTNTKALGKLIFLFILVGGVIAGFYLVRRSQIIASYALTPAAVGNISVNAKDESGGLTKVDVLFKTGEGQSKIEAISTIALSLKVSSKSGKSIILIDGSGNDAASVRTGEKITDSKEWEFPVNISRKDGNNLLIDFSAVNENKNGYSSENQEALLTFWIKGTDNNDLSFEFDKDQSVMLSKRRPVTNIWNN